MHAKIYGHKSNDSETKNIQWKGKDTKRQAPKLRAGVQNKKKGYWWGNPVSHDNAQPCNLIAAICTFLITIIPSSLPTSITFHIRPLPSLSYTYVVNSGMCKRATLLSIKNSRPPLWIPWGVTDMIMCCSFRKRDAGNKTGHKGPDPAATSRLQLSFFISDDLAEFLQRR